MHGHCAQPQASLLLFTCRASCAVSSTAKAAGKVQESGRLSPCRFSWAVIVRNTLHDAWTPTWMLRAWIPCLAIPKVVYTCNCPECLVVHQNCPLTNLVVSESQLSVKTIGWAYTLLAPCGSLGYCLHATRSTARSVQSGLLLNFAQLLCCHSKNHRRFFVQVLPLL